jgi:hypothetical protein
VDEWIMKYGEPFLTVSSSSSLAGGGTSFSGHGLTIGGGGSSSVILNDENSSSSQNFNETGTGNGSSTPNHYPLPPLAGPFSSGGFNASSFVSHSGGFDQYDCLLPPLEPSLDFENIMDLGNID